MRVLDDIRRPLTEQDEDAIVAAYEAGERVAEMAPRLGISVPTIYAVLKRRFVPIRDRRGHRPVTQEEAASISALYRDGVPVSVIARRVGLSEASVYRVLRRVGIARKPTGPRPNTVCPHCGGSFHAKSA